MKNYHNYKNNAISVQSIIFNFARLENHYHSLGPGKDSPWGSPDGYAADSGGGYLCCPIAASENSLHRWYQVTVDRNFRVATSRLLKLFCDFIRVLTNINWYILYDQEFLIWRWRKCRCMSLNAKTAPWPKNLSKWVPKKSSAPSVIKRPERSYPPARLVWRVVAGTLTGILPKNLNPSSKIMD